MSPPPTAIAIDPFCVHHSNGGYHPEAPERIETLIDLVESEPEARELGLLRLGERLAMPEDVLRVHDPAYFSKIERTAGRTVSLDPDTGAAPRSFEAAMRAAGAALESMDAVVAGTARNAFAIARPPGHHAERNCAKGFCLFNSVAVTAAYAREVHGMRRVAVVDFDVHHGNGTMHSFWEDPDTLYISTHQYPYYPGTGSYMEIGGGRGRGATLNLPLRGGHGDDEYDALYGALVGRVLDQFAPDAILVSAGYDVMDADPLGAMYVTPGGIGAVAGHLVAAAERLCDGRLVVLLEGGYDLAALRAGVLETLRAMVRREGGSAPLPELDEGRLGDPAHYLHVLREVFRI